MLITISPKGRGRYCASVDGQRIVESALCPFYSAARALVAKDFDPDLEIKMRHEGSDITAMRGKIGQLAGLTVIEPDADGHGCIRAVRYRPFRAGALPIPMDDPRLKT